MGNCASAEDVGESAIGIHGIGAPARDDCGAVAAAISITTPAAQIDEQKHQLYIRVTGRHANQLSMLLGPGG